MIYPRQKTQYQYIAILLDTASHPYFREREREIYIYIYIYTYTDIYVYIYTLWLFDIAMENGPFIDDLPIKNGDFPWLC